MDSLVLVKKKCNQNCPQSFSLIITWSNIYNGTTVVHGPSRSGKSNFCKIITMNYLPAVIALDHADTMIRRNIQQSETITLFVFQSQPCSANILVGLTQCYV